jgi:hypothetical protein
MKFWLFPISAIFIVIITLSLIYFGPEIFPPQKLISPIADASSITPTRNPLTVISTPKPVLAISTTISPTPKTGITSITLTAQKISTSSAQLLWNLDGSAQTGFVVLTSSASAPLFPPRPGDQIHTLLDPATRGFTLDNLFGSVYLRVCELLENSCGTYSNQISLEF